MQRQTLLDYARHRYLKLAGLVIALAALAYALHRPPLAPYGGTPLGYALGTVAALLVCWQMWLGVRRRSYRSDGALQGWVSAHVYLGGAVLVLVPLHSGFSIGWSIHGLAYGLMLATGVSGLYGVYAYQRLPSLITANLGEERFDDLLLNIADLDERAQAQALHLADEIGAAVMRAARQTAVGGSVFRQLRGHHPDCPTRMALRLLEARGEDTDASRAGHQRELYSTLLRKESLLIRVRRHVAHQARLEFWMYLHAPLAVASAVALAAHIVATLVYR